MDVYRVQTGTKYGTLFADDDADLAKLKTWFIDNIKLDLAEDSTLTDSVIDQTADNWAGGNTVINKSMGLEAWS